MPWNVPNQNAGTRITAAIWNYFVNAFNSIESRLAVVEGLTTQVSAVNNTAVTANSTTYVPTGTVISVSGTVPPSGKLKVTVSARQLLTTGAGPIECHTSAAISGAAGSSSANRERSLVTNATGAAVSVGAQAGSKSFVITGLTAGAAYTCTMQHRISGTTGGAVGTFDDRSLIVEPILGYVV